MTITQSSVFIGFFLSIGNYIRDTGRYSIVGRFLCAAAGVLGSIWNYVWDKGRYGVVARFFRWVGAGIADCARGSRLCQLVSRDGTLPKIWPQSVVCRAGTVLFNLPNVLMRQVRHVGEGSVLRRLGSGSLLCRLIAALLGVPFFFLGLLVMVMLLVPHESWNNLYGLIGAIAVFFLFAVGVGSRTRQRLEPDRLGPYMAIYMGFICYGLASSLSLDLSLRFFFFHLTAFLIVLLTVSLVRRFEQLQLMVAMAIFGLTLASIYGCYQGYVGVPVVASQQDMILNAGMPGRVYSFFDNPNNFAELLVMLIPLDLALIVNARTWRGRLWSIVALVPCVAAIGYTLSRSGWIGLCLAVVIFLAFQNWRFIPVILMLGLLAIPILPESIYNRILTIGNMKDTSTSYRFAIYGASGNLMRDYWYRGVGLGSDVMKQVFQEYPPMFDGNYPIHTHNNYLQMWGETGILGLLSFLALLGSQLKGGFKAFRSGTEPRVKTMLSAALAGFGGILVISVAEYTWFYPRNMFIYFFLFGVIGACIKLSKGESHARLIN